MSPRWRDELAIYLGPRKLVLSRRGRWPRTRELTTEIPVAAGPPGEAAFAPVVARLAKVLADPGWHDASARVVVADPWTRFCVVPWPEAHLDGEGRLRHARFLIEDTYGEAVADWTVTLADTPPGRALLACAMPGTIRAALEEALTPARLALASLQPRLVVAFNGWRRRLPAGDAWFISVDDGSLSALHLADGAWDRVHTARLSPDWSVELARLQALGRLTRALGGPVRMLVDAPARMRAGAGPLPGIEWLEEDEQPEGDEPRTPELGLLRRMSA